jgi:hypothetical protein
VTTQPTTRIAPQYAAALKALRRDIGNDVAGTINPAKAQLLLDRVQDLADELMRGTAPLVQVAVGELELPSDVDVGGLLDDSEPMLSSMRDQRRPE